MVHHAATRVYVFSLCGYVWIKLHFGSFIIQIYFFTEVLQVVLGRKKSLKLCLEVKNLLYFYGEMYFSEEEL